MEPGIQEGTVGAVRGLAIRYASDLMAAHLVLGFTLAEGDVGLRSVVV